MTDVAAGEVTAAGRAGRHIAYIDGLRAVAVLAVIAFHLDASLLPGGFAGVDVFFVISGFVVSASLARFDRPRLREYLTYFYSRRLRRIAPALIVCLLVTSVATALLIPAAWLSDTNDATGLRAFVGLSNFHLLATSGDYFSPQTEFNPYTHTWSLGVEEQFYLIFPLLFALWSHRRRSASIALFGAATLGSLALGWASAADHPASAFYLLTYRFWELGAGVLLFQALTLRGERATIPPRLATGGAAAAAVALAAGLWLASEDRTPFPDGILPVLGTLGLLGFLFDGTGGAGVRRVLESRPAVAVGKISYSLYLWHWPTFVLFRWTAGLDTVLAGACALAITFAAATASYLFVERPFRYAGVWARVPRMAVIGAGAVVVAASALAYRAIVDQQPELSLSTVVRHAADWYPDGRGAASLARECEPPEGLDLDGGELRVFARSCERPGAGGRLLVAGDSHALAYQAMLRETAVRTGRGVFQYTRGGCTVLSLRVERRDRECRRFVAAALRDVGRRARAGDVVFLPSLRIARLSDQWGQLEAPPAPRAIPNRFAAARRRRIEDLSAQLLQPLAARGVRVVLPAPTPLFRAPPFRCADSFNRGNPVCAPGFTTARAEIESLRAPILRSMRRLATSVEGVSVWDPFPLLCPGATCHAHRDGRPLFFDGDHLSGHANRLLLPSFMEHLAGG